MLPVAAGGILAWAVAVPWRQAPAPRLLPIAIASALGLERVFAGYGYRWPPHGPVPPLALARLPRDLAALAPARRKRTFLRALLPLVIAADDRIRAERRVLLEAFAHGTASARVRRLARRYRVSGALDNPTVRKRLLRRCDTVPPGLVLAQAAKESGWGTSAFALEANNLFGMRTWDPQAGAVPSARRPGASYLVRAYPDLAASVRDYLYNLNVGHAYQRLRRVRARERARGGRLDALALAHTLHRYSQRRSAYVTRLGNLMVANGLQELPPLRLAATPPPTVGLRSTAPAKGPSSPWPVR